MHVPQEGERRGEFAVQMGGEAVGGVQRRRFVDQPTELGEQSAASGYQAVVAQKPGVAAVAQLESGLQDGLHPGGPRAARMIGSELPRSPDQVSQTRLVQRVGEAAIRRPPVAHEHAGEVGSQDRCRVVEPAAGANRVDRRLGRGEGPQPVAHGADAPAGFIRRDHGRFPHLLAQCGVGRRGLASRAMQHLREASRCDGQAELGPEQVRDLRQRHTQVRVQPHDQRDDFGTELHAGRSQRVGGLQPVAALDATPTLRAVADLDVEAPHDGAHHREIFLILRRHPGQLDGAAAVRTRGSHRRSAGLVNLRRTRAARLPAVVRTCAPAGSSAATLGPVLGEGSRLPESCPPRRVELLLEVFTAALPPIPVTLPPIPIALDPRQLLAQSCDLSLLFLNAGIAGILLRPGTLPWHPTVMPDPLEKYKSKMLDLARHETTPLNKYDPGFREGVEDLAVQQFIPPTGAVVYYLYFASQNKTGARIVKDIFDTYGARGTA